jgi:hypothetical protein
MELIESLDLDKMHLMVEEACKGLAGVSASQVEMTSGIQFYEWYFYSRNSRNSYSQCK